MLGDSVGVQGGWRGMQENSNLKSPVRPSGQMDIHPGGLYTTWIACPQSGRLIIITIAEYTFLGCKSSFRRIILSGRRFTCSLQNLTSLKHVLRCRACRFDRSILMGMNPLSLKLPEGTDIDAICAEITNKRHFLLQKFKDTKLIWTQACPVIDDTLEGRQLEWLVMTESKINKVRNAAGCLMGDVKRLDHPRINFVETQ
uniref:Nuclear receptor domain-containing protein n=1 Tax=Ditylenchus dipsaci TaxID=166011 RepID=A0A915E4B0_9BILA